MEPPRRKSRRKRCTWSLALACASVICLLILVSNSGLPDIAKYESRKELGRTPLSKEPRSPSKPMLSELGRMMVAMLPDDLPFTIFVPSEEAFQRILKLRPSDSLQEPHINSTFAVLSRLMGFSSVPRHLPSPQVPLGKEVSFDSVSGFRLFVWRDTDGSLLVNNVRSSRLDLVEAETIVHVMSGVIMDAEFAQSFSLDYEK